MNDVSEIAQAKKLWSSERPRNTHAAKTHCSIFFVRMNQKTWPESSKESPWARPQESMARPCETDMSEALTLTVTLSESLNTLKTAKRVRTRPGLEAPMSKGSRGSKASIGSAQGPDSRHRCQKAPKPPMALANSRLNCSVISSAFWTTHWHWQTVD